MPGLVKIVAECAADLPPEIRAGVVPRVLPKADDAPPPEKCGFITGTFLENGLPLPGSKEFCDVVPQIARALDEIAVALFGWAEKQNPIETLIGKLELNVDDANDPWYYRLVAWVWNWLVFLVKVAVGRSLDWVTRLIRDLVYTIKCFAKQYNPSASIAIWAIITIWDLVGKWEAGINFIGKVSTTFGIDSRVVRDWLTYLDNYFAPLEIPPAEVATEAWLQNRISKEQRDCIWKMNGLAPSTYEPFAATRNERLGWRESIQFIRRRNLPGEMENFVLRERGFVTPQDVDMAREMYWELPTISDHLHWLQRNVFNKEYVRDFQLMEGFNEKFWPEFGPDLTALGMRKEYAEKHYAAHWIMPSPEQMRRFLYRTDEIEAATGKGFTLNDYERVLTEQDYNILARKWFSSTAYEVPAISYVKEWYRQGIINDAELKKYHRWLGYNPKDAENFLKVDDLQKKRMRQQAINGGTPRNANALWFAGQWTEDEHTRAFEFNGYTKEEAHDARQITEGLYKAQVLMQAKRRALNEVVKTVFDAIDVGTITPAQGEEALINAGWPQNIARSATQSSFANSGNKHIRTAITYIKRNYLNGVINARVAQRELGALGLQTLNVLRYLRIWNLQRTAGRKRRSAAAITKDVASGSLTTPQAIVMLRNLGYTDADTRLYLADAQQKLLKIEQGRLAAADKAGKARSRQLEKMAKAAEKQHKDTVRAMIKDMPVSKLEKWLKLNIVGKAYFERRMLAYGYSPEEITYRIEEVCKSKGAECNGIKADQASVDGSGGSGGVDGGGSNGSPPVV